MIARVYPLLRMPRRTDVFDYRVPEHLVIERGMIVVIPFRARIVFGVVESVTHDLEYQGKLKELVRIEASVKFTSNELRFFESLANELAQSVSSILFSAVPTVPKRPSKKPLPQILHKTLMIPKGEAEELTLLAKQIAGQNRAFGFVSDIRRMACVITAYGRLFPNEKCIVLCPTILDAKRLAEHIDAVQWILTGNESAGLQFSTWKSYREATSGVLIGTKNALFAADEKTHTVFLVRSSHENHGHHEQNPRFDARIVANQLANSIDSRIYFLDSTPRLEDFDLFKTFDWPQKTHEGLQLIDMSQQTRGSKVGFWFSHQLLQEMTETLKNKKRVLLMLNQKDRLSELQSILRTEFPEAMVHVIDKEHPEEASGASIIIATSFYTEQIFDAFHPSPFAIVAMLHADAAFYRDGFRVSELAMQECERIYAMAQACRAMFFVQTQTPSAFQHYFDDRKTFYSDEMDARRSYAHPPTVDLMTVELKSNRYIKTPISFSEIIKHLRAISPDCVLEQADEAQNQRLSIRSPRTDRTEILAYFRTLPDHVIIDTQAFLG